MSDKERHLLYCACGAPFTETSWVPSAFKLSLSGGNTIFIIWVSQARGCKKEINLWHEEDADKLMEV